MALFLWDEFEVIVTIHSISRALASVDWSKKAARRVAQKRNADLRDFYLHASSTFRSYQLVFVDESGCDKRIGFRRTGWSPFGVILVQVARFQRDQREQRHQIWPAITQDGIILARVFQGSTDGAIFEDFIEQLLSHCGKWPEPKSALVMDNSAFHHMDRIMQICLDAGVKLMYLPPYSPDLNLIVEFFAELKAFIKRNWQVCKYNREQGFDIFLEWYINVVGEKKSNAKGYLRHYTLNVKEL